MLSRWIFAPVMMAALLSSAPPSRPAAVVRGVCLGCKDTPFQLGDVHFVNAREGWSTAYYWPPGNGSGLATLLHTTDGGRHWRRVPFVWQNGAESGPPFSFSDRLHGWVAWHDQFAHHFSRTSDGGRSWTHRPSSPISHVGFFDARSGYSVEATDHGWFFRLTRDGGQTWSSDRLPLSSAAIVSFFDSRTGVIVGGDRILFTTDGGAHWTSARTPSWPPSDAHSLTWIDARAAMLVRWDWNGGGSELFRTTDGGGSWTRHPDESLQGKETYIEAVAVAPDGRGYLFLDEHKKSFIATTTDGGASWTARRPFPYTVASCQLFEGQVWCSSGMKIIKLDLPTRGG